MQLPRLGRFFCLCSTVLGVAVSCQDKAGVEEPEAIGKVSSAATSSDGGVAASPLPSINTFVVYAANDVSLGTGDHSLGGDIGVATSNGSSPQLSVGSLDGLDTNHTLFASSVALGSGAIVGPVATNALTNAGARLGAQSTFPTSMPPLPTIFPATPTATNVTVAQGQQVTLSPGNFGTLTDNGLLFLNPGVYSFSNITLGNNAQVQALPGGSTNVRIAGAFATGTFCQVFPVGQDANALTFSVSGSDGPSGGPPAAALGANTQIIALVVAPNGSLGPAQKQPAHA